MYNISSFILISENNGQRHIRIKLIPKTCENGIITNININLLLSNEKLSVEYFNGCKV